MIGYNTIMRLRTLFTLGMLILGTLVACSSEAEPDAAPELPTVAALPSATASLTAAPGAAIRATLPPTFTEAPISPTPSVTETVTVTPSNTITDTPTRTATATPSETLVPNAVNSLAELARQATVFPSTFLPPGLAPTPISQPTTAPFAATPPPSTTCQFLPPGGFGQIVLNDPTVIAEIGCPVGAPPVTASVGGASQPFERGSMAWLNEGGGVIYIFNLDGTFQRVNDTYDPNVDPERSGEIPPAGLQEPIRGFGKVWRTVIGVRDGIGWATLNETGGESVVQEFTQGRMMYLPSRGDILILTYQGSPAAGTWRAVPGAF